MRTLPSIAFSVLFASGTPLYAANLMLDFGATPVAEPYLTLSPGHDSGWIAEEETTWNTITSSETRSDLLLSSGIGATGVTLVLGQEATGGANEISYTTGITNLALAGTGGNVAGQQSLLIAGSIYGSDSSSTAVGRDGFFGGGTGTGTGAAIGVRVDGLEPGVYTAYVMARNTNSSAPSYPMNIYSTTGASTGTFDFSSLTAIEQTNIGYASATYDDNYGSFEAGDNYVAVNFTVGAGDSFFLAVDGANDAQDRRGFMNMVQIVAIPEPSAALLGALGLLTLIRRRR